MNINHLWASLVIEELIRCGVLRFVIAPGSRSTPLAVAALRNPRAITTTHFDERGAAFFALGAGRMGRPAAVICTSGTAVANCFPAVAEAAQSALPLIILSADRPPELHDCGANQTMNQQQLFGQYTRAFLNLPCPAWEIAPEAVLTRIDAVVARALTPGECGPVHINGMYREPLAPTERLLPGPTTYLNALDYWSESQEPLTEWRSGPRTLTENQIDSACGLLAMAQHGLILIGRMYTDEERDAALEVAFRLGWPVFADITSGCRMDIDCDNLVGCYDLLLHSPCFQKFCFPDCILHIGDSFVSKRLQQHLARLSPVYIHLSGRGENRDPIARVTYQLQADIARSCRQLVESAPDSENDLLVARYRAFDDAAKGILQQVISKTKSFSELLIARIISSALEEPGSQLYLGNSMPVRSMDMAAFDVGATTVHANRGVSGIDGNIATAAGMAWAANRRTVALIGDTTALHDLNSLALIAKMNLPVTLVIVNNGGGGIFSLLPIATSEDVFEQGFRNPHSWRFKDAARMFGINYIMVSEEKRFEAALTNALNSDSPVIVEALVEQERNVDAYKQMQAAMSELEDAGDD